MGYHCCFIGLFHKAAELRGGGMGVSSGFPVIQAFYTVSCSRMSGTNTLSCGPLIFSRHTGHPWASAVAPSLPFQFSSVFRGTTALAGRNVVEISVIDVAQPAQIKPNLSMRLETTKPTKVNEMQHVKYDVCISGGWLFKECGSMDEAFWQQRFVFVFFQTTKYMSSSIVTFLLSACYQHFIM